MALNRIILKKFSLRKEPYQVGANFASCSYIGRERQRMLSNHLQNGVETAKLIWSRLPNSEVEADGAASEEFSRIKKDDGSSTVESLDYEVIENYAYRQEQAKRGKVYMAYSVVVKWLMALLIGIGTALAAVFINISVENFAGWKYSWTFNLIQKSYFAGFLVYTLINLALVLSSVYIVTQFSPEAAGSGIPEIKGYLNGIDTHGILLFRTLVGKIFGSIGSVGGGLALGKEGPLVHIGACIASMFGQASVTCGCAAGVAAAFRAPVGGVLFALEEVTSCDLFFLIQGGGVSSCGVSFSHLPLWVWLYRQQWHGVRVENVDILVLEASSYGTSQGDNLKALLDHEFHTDPSVLTFILTMVLFSGQEDYSFQELLPMAVIGVIGGLLGALFNQLTFHIAYWRRNYLHKRGNRVKVIEVCIVSLITSLISFGLPLFRKCTSCPEPDADSGIECPQRPGMYGNYVNFYCGDKEYNDLATIFFNTQDDAIRNLFSAKTIHEFSAQSLLTFLVMFYSLAVVTFGTAVPAGQFVPGIMIGSTYGRLVGMFAVNFYQKLNIEEGTYALLGAASFLGGSMRMTVSLCVIMVEISNNLKFLPLIMLVLLISKAVGDAFNEGLYEEQARLRAIPLLESRPKYQMRSMTAKEASGNQQVVYFPRVVKVVDVLSILRSNNHNGFPVIDHTRSGETLVIGLILRRHNLTEFVKPVSSKGITIDDIHLTPDDLEMYIDLAPFLNSSPYVVPEDMSLTKVYTLFRQLGLRHLLVVPRASRVIGMISRKDLLIEDHEDTTAVELQSTSISILKSSLWFGRDHQDDRRVSRRKDAEQPLLDGLIV
ncbi:hypothetical protein SASPL_116654 [Salvia splendens]|uniref:Chloride channel protein n=1 Tax=Salvia splendens TaxID=180675 RepID=A0A8X8XTD1_SALSN|nr:hypothetical protein SASPL_116654 [Salvia splendens]